MKIRDNSDILLLLERHKGVLVDWDEHRERFWYLYSSVYSGIDIRQKYKLFTKGSNLKKPFSCYSSDVITNLIGKGKVIEDKFDVFYIL